MTGYKIKTSLKILLLINLQLKMGWYSCYYKNINILLIIWLMVCLWCISICSYSIAIEVSYDERALKIDGERRIILSGSIHYPRSTPKVIYIYIYIVVAMSN